jgi:hypothetical protein
LTIVGAIDPNDITGPTGYGAQRWVAAEQVLPYTIRFENLSTATAPAQEVIITHHISEVLDLSRFELGSMGFGDVVIDVPAGLMTYSHRLNLRDTLGHDVQIQAELDASTRTATWRFTSIDPDTGELVRDPLDGFLPPNDDTGAGEGFVTFTIRADSGLPGGTAITAKASIVFDSNEPIETNEFLNTVDSGAPSSQVEDLAETTFFTDVEVSWSGFDEEAGAGVATYDVYVSDNDGPFTRWLAGATADTAEFTGEDGHTYRFYSVARDNVGHAERSAATAEAETTLNLHPWRNPNNGLDINDDGHVTPIPDVIARVNEINSRKYMNEKGQLPLPPPSPIPFYYDRDGDNMLTPVQDILPAVNFLNTGGGGEPESSEPAPRQFVTLVPDLTGGASPFTAATARPSNLLPGDDRGDESTERVDRYFAVAADAEPATIQPVRPMRSTAADDSRADLEAILEGIALEIGLAWSVIS